MAGSKCEQEPQQAATLQPMAKEPMALPLEEWGKAMYECYYCHHKHDQTELFNAIWYKTITIGDKTITYLTFYSRRIILGNSMSLMFTKEKFQGNSYWITLQKSPYLNLFRIN